MLQVTNLGVKVIFGCFAVVAVKEGGNTVDNTVIVCSP